MLYTDGRFHGPVAAAADAAPERRPALDADSAWHALLALRDWRRRRAGAAEDLSVLPSPAGGPEPAVVPGRAAGALLWSAADGGWSSPAPADRNAARLLDLYLPLCRAMARPGRPYVAAHLGQSLDGRIATVSGSSQWVTGAADLTHTHRMRALADAVLVGAGTVHQDDPQLTVRRVRGDSPLRVVIDGERRLSDGFRLFRDGAAPTLLLCAEDAPGSDRLGQAEVIRLPRGRRGGLDPAAIGALLAARGIGLLFVEGGGVTVSRFLEARCVDRLQLTVAPLILGSGRPAIALPEVEEVGRGLRPRVRHVALDSDVMFECIFDG